MGDEVYGNYIVIDQREATFCDRSHVKRQTHCQTGRWNEMEDIEHLNMNSSLGNLYYACDRNTDSSRRDDVRLPYGAGRSVHNLHDVKTDNSAPYSRKQTDSSVRHFCIRTPEEIDINSLEDEDIMMASRQVHEGCSELLQREYTDTYTRESPYSAETVSTPDKSGPYNENYHHVRDDSLVHTVYTESVFDPNMNVDQKKHNRRNKADNVEERKQARLYDSIIPTSPVIDTHTFGVRSAPVRMCLRDQYDEPVTDEMGSYRHGQHAEEPQTLSDNELCVRDRLSAGNTTHEQYNTTEGTSDSSRSSVPSSGDVKMMSTRISGDHLSDRSPESMDLSQLSTPRDSSPEKVSPLIPIHPPGELTIGDESHIRKRRQNAEDRHVLDSQTDERYSSPQRKQTPNVIPPSRETHREDGNTGEERIWSSSSFSIHGDVYEEGRESLRRPTARMVSSHPLNRQASLDYGDADEDLYSPPRHDELGTLHEGPKDGRVSSPDDEINTFPGQSQTDLEVQYISRSRHSSGASSVASARDFGSRNRTINVPNYLQQQYLDSGIGSDTGSPMDSRVLEQVNLEWQNESKHSSGSSHRTSGRERGHTENSRHGASGFQIQQSGSVKSVNRRQTDHMASPSKTRSEIQVRTGSHLQSFQPTGPRVRRIRINRVESLPIMHLQQKRESDQTGKGSQVLRKCYGEKRSKSDDAGSYTKWVKDGQCQKTKPISSIIQDTRIINTSHQNIDKLNEFCVDKRDIIDLGHHPEGSVENSTVQTPIRNSAQDIHNYQSTESPNLNVPVNEGMKNISKQDHMYNDGSSRKLNDRNEGKQEIVNTRQLNKNPGDELRTISNEKSCELSRPESAKGNDFVVNEEIPDRHVQNRCDMSSGRNERVDRGSDRYEMDEKYRNCTEMSEKDRRHPISHNRQKCQDMQDNRDRNIAKPIAKPRVGKVQNETGTENIDQGRLEISNHSSDVISRETVLQKAQPRETVKTCLGGSPRSTQQTSRHLIEDNMSQQEVMIDLRDKRQQLSDREGIPEPLEHEVCADRYLSQDSQRRTNQGERPSWDGRQDTVSTGGQDNHVSREYVGERDSRQNQQQYTGERDCRQHQGQYTGERDSRQHQGQNTGEKDSRQHQGQNISERDSRQHQRQNTSERDFRQHQGQNTSERDSRQHQGQYTSERDSRQHQGQYTSDKDSRQHQGQYISERDSRQHQGQYISERDSRQHQGQYTSERDSRQHLGQNTSERDSRYLGQDHHVTEEYVGERDSRRHEGQRDSGQHKGQRASRQPEGQRDSRQPQVQRDSKQPQVQRDSRQPQVQRDSRQPQVQRDSRQPQVQRDSRQPQVQPGYYQGEGTMPGQQQKYSDMDTMRRDKVSHYDDVFYDERQGHPAADVGMKQDRGHEARQQGHGRRSIKHAEDVNNVHVDAYNQHGHAEQHGLQHGSRHTVKADVHTNNSPVAPHRGHSRRGEYSQVSSMHGHSKYKQKPKYPFSRIQFDSSVSPKDYMEGPDSLYPMREQGGIQGSHDIGVLTSSEFLQSSGTIKAPIATQEQHHASWNQTIKTDGPVSLQDPADMNSQDGGGQSEAKTTSSSSQMHSAGHSQASHASTNHSQSAAANESQAQAQSQVNGSVIEDRKNLKNLPIEEVLGRTKAIVAELGKLEEYHRGDGMRLQKMLGDFYWDYTSQRQQIGNGIAEAGYAEITIKMLKSLNTIGIFKNDDVWFPAYYTYNTTWNYSDSSDLLAKNLAEADAVRLLTLNCSHKPYITNIHSKNVYYVMKASMSILHNIARNPNVKSYFKENKTAEVIMPFINMNDDMLRVLAMLTLAYIVEEEDNSKLIDETGTIKNVVMWISKALDNPKRRFKGFTPQELTQGLDKLAVNDGNKPKIIEEGSIPLFMKMIQSENEKEQSTTARCIWTLAFDKDVRKQLLETENLMSRLEKLTESQVKDVKKNVQGALWVLTGKGDAPTDRPRSASRGKNHIFISYSWNEQEKVLEIRDKLRSEGYVVWVDVDQMGGSTLQAMAEAVENAAVVLVCMSEKYKQSPNCRTEAEYTFQLRKDYIPLMMQKKYRPDGWLGMILGAKLFFDFSGKYPFEKSASGLLKELRGRGKRSNVIQGQGSDDVDALQATADNQLVHAGNPHRNMHPGTELALPQGHQPQTCHMSRDDVQRWLIAHQLDGSIAAFSQFDGRLLWQLREMKHEAADYFYQCLEKKLNMNLIDMLRLASALDTLH